MAIDSCGARFDKVFVNPGIYYDSLSIGNDKSVQIHGADATTTIIHGSGENSVGLSMSHSKFNTFEGFMLTNFSQGIYMDSCRLNKIFNNKIIENNGPGISIWLTFGNIFFGNTFINNSEHIFGLDNFNLWYNPIRLRGNFWDDYTIRYPNAKPRPLLSWSWNTPYTTSILLEDFPFQMPFFRFFLNCDHFPLINPPSL